MSEFVNTIANGRPLPFRYYENGNNLFVAFDEIHFIKSRQSVCPMKSIRPICALLILSLLAKCTGTIDDKTALNSGSWPDTLEWWKANNLRLVQTNLPAYEAGLNPDSLLEDLTRFSANTLIINAGGIMAFYPTKLKFQYTNPYMKEHMLEDVIARCHDSHIRVIVRFDFSRAHKQIFDAHPEWFYISKNGERIINEDMYAVSINAPYEQEWLFRIVEEVIDNYPIDGLFINMPGYQTSNPYLGIYYGIDQNEYDKKRFSDYSGGMDLPLEEDPADPVFRKYQEFRKYTTDDLMERLHQLVKSKSRQIAICTYMAPYVDIIRHESQTNSLPYWPYNASDNVNNTRNSYPDHIVSNASIQQISFRSRYNAVEPEEVAIRLYENIANGSGLDISLMGDFRDYEDERNYETIEKVYAHHKKYEPYFGHYTSPSEVAVVAPGYWPGGEAAQEYRGIQLMLKEAHIQFDIIEDSQVGNLGEKIKGYRLLILPEITDLDDKAIDVLTSACKEGTNLIATNRSLKNNPEALLNLFGAKAIEADHDGNGFYLNPANKNIFKRFRDQTLVFWKFNLGFYDFTAADTAMLPILTPGRPGPPEIIGGHETTGYFAMGVKNHPSSRAVTLPVNLGRLYYIHGYKEHKNILLDAIDYVCPEVNKLIQTDAHERVEVILQHFVRNIPQNVNSDKTDGMILHLVNVTGFSGNTYFNPLPVYNTSFEIRTGFRPSAVWSMMNQRPVDFTYEDGSLKFRVAELGQFEGIVVER